VRADPIGIMDVESICNCELRIVIPGTVGDRGFCAGDQSTNRNQNAWKVLTTKYLSMSFPKPAP
jgi:hypothetical protein